MSAISEAGRRDLPDVRAGRAWVGPSDRMVLGYPRAWVATAACATLLAVSGTQFGFGTVTVRLDAAAHWGPLAAAWGLAAWAACHAAAGRVLSLSRRQLSVNSAKTATFGAACGALGLLFGGAVADPAGPVAVGPVALSPVVVSTVVSTVAAGTGTGLVYGTCATVVKSWFPGPRFPAALVGWAFGAFPFALAVLSGAAAPLGALAWVSLAVTALCAPFLRDAPRGWRPSEAMSLNHASLNHASLNRTSLNHVSVNHTKEIRRNR